MRYFLNKEEIRYFEIIKYFLPDDEISIKQFSRQIFLNRRYFEIMRYFLDKEEMRY